MQEGKINISGEGSDEKIQVGKTDNERADTVVLDVTEDGFECHWSTRPLWRPRRPPWMSG